MRGLSYIFVITALIFVFVPRAYAAPTLQDQSCMPEVMSTIQAVGLLEAQREITQNQNLLAKPDSVLEYSCFEQHLTLSGDQALHLFSEAEWFFQIDDPFIDNMSLDRSLYAVVMESLIEYLQANFWHRYLGDRADLANLPTGGSGFLCYAMGYVWHKAKCSNFIDPRKDQDGFYTFAEYRDMTEDPRNLPSPQKCNVWPDWADTITASKRLNAEIDSASASGPLDDKIKRFNEFFSAEGSCGPPVKTGIYVPPYKGAGVEGFDEFVCTNPGCYYNGSTCTRG